MVGWLSGNCAAGGGGGTILTRVSSDPTEMRDRPATVP